MQSTLWISCILKSMKKRVKKILAFCTSSQAIFILCLELIFGAFCSSVALAVFFKLAEDVLEKEPVSFDPVFIHALYASRTPALTTLMQMITAFGGEIVLTFAVIVTILFLVRKRVQDALIFSFILFVGIELNLFLKIVFSRPRPNLLPLVVETTYSFPSGHAMNSFIFYGSLSYFVFRKLANKKLAGVLIAVCFFLIFAIGVSRVYLGAHYPSDVLAGFATGFLWFCVVLLFEKTLYLWKLYRDF